MEGYKTGETPRAANHDPGQDKDMLPNNNNQQEHADFLAGADDNKVKELVQSSTTRQSKSNLKTFRSILQLLTPTKKYFFTPLIVITNIVVYLLMVFDGVDPFFPTVEGLIEWGGNLRFLTLDGQQWRLITSVFVHGGILHLLFNMYALISIGAFIETGFGKYRYFFGYLATGLLASITSTSYHDNIVSVGASGAIFGIYGLLLSLLLFKVISVDAEARKNIIASTVFFIVFNIAFGFSIPGIDNAAHIGGLVSGFIIGLAYYPSIKRPILSKFISISLAVVIAGIIWAMPNFIDNEIGEFNAAMKKFEINEKKASWVYYENLSVLPPEKLTYYKLRLQVEGIDLWKENLRLMTTLTDLKPELHERVELIKKYCELRIELLEKISESINNENTENQAQIERISSELTKIIEQVSNKK